jgi:hypothetical protein
MRKFRIELTAPFDPYHLNWQNMDWLDSPIGKLCKELDRKQWLECDEGSLGHTIIANLAPQIPNATTSWVEVNLMAEMQEEMATRKLMENSHLSHSLRQRAPVIRLPRKPWGYN